MSAAKPPTDFRGLSGPEGSQVNSGVARPPALDEALDRRMQDNVIQVVEAEQAVSADGRVLGVDRLERASAEVAREDDVDDVLRREALHGRDRVDDRDRALDRHLLVDPKLLPELAVEGVDQALPRVHAPAGQEPVLLAGLLVTAEQHSVVPAQQRRDADPRLHHGHKSRRASCRAPAPRSWEARLHPNWTRSVSMLTARERN